MRQWRVRLDRAITNYFREYWPDRPHVMPVAASFALPGAAVGGLVGWLLGDAEGGAVIGSVVGLFIGIAWVFIAVATWGRSSRRWEESQREVFVRPTSHVRRKTDAD
jgi:putative exporter of polyketide antibiotics